MIKGNFETRQVWIDGVELKPQASQKLYNHSPDGFNWGMAVQDQHNLPTSPFYG